MTELYSTYRYACTTIACTPSSVPRLSILSLHLSPYLSHGILYYHFAATCFHPARGRCKSPLIGLAISPNHFLSLLCCCNLNGGQKVNCFLSLSFPSRLSCEKLSSFLTFYNHFERTIDAENFILAQVHMYKLFGSLPRSPSNFLIAAGPNLTLSCKMVWN
jgi:hypothetical protein